MLDQLSKVWGESYRRIFRYFGTYNAITLFDKNYDDDHAFIQGLGEEMKSYEMNHEAFKRK